MHDLPVVVDSRLRLPPGLPRDLVAALKRVCTHDDPGYRKKRARGYWAPSGTSRIATWEVHDKGTVAESLSLPRGATARLREQARAHGFRERWLDRRVTRPRVEWPPFRRELRYYQDEILEACMFREQGVIRLPTGGGKSLAALALAAHARQPALVVMRNSRLLDQWVRGAEKDLGMDRAEIGVLEGGKKLRIGQRLTVALQQTLYSASFPLDDVAHLFGTVVVDEVHQVAAKTFQQVIDQFPARYRIGFSADETRKDGKEFLVYDQFGGVIYEKTRQSMEAEGWILPVQVVMVPTDFRADWYVRAASGERDWNVLLDELTTDVARNDLIVSLLRDVVVAAGDTPAIAFSHRVDHARALADEHLFEAGVRCGLLLGGKKELTRFEEDRVQLLDGAFPVATGTYEAIGTGIDMPAVAAGAMVTPIGSNRQFFGQVRGRICRTSESTGKKTATLYVIWDRHVFPRMKSDFEKWNDGRVVVRELGDLVRERAA